MKWMITSRQISLGGIRRSNHSHIASHISSRSCHPPRLHEQDSAHEQPTEKHDERDPFDERERHLGVPPREVGGCRVGY